MLLAFQMYSCNTSDMQGDIQQELAQLLHVHHYMHLLCG